MPKRCLEAVASHLAGQFIPGLGANEITVRIENTTSKVKAEGLSGSAAIAEVNKRVLEGLKAEAKRAKVVTAHDVQMIRSKIEWIRDVYTDRPDLGLKAMLVGDVRTREGSRASVDLAQKTAIGQYNGDLLANLREAKVIGPFLTGTKEFQRDVYRAADMLWRKDPAIKDLDPKVVKVAEVLESLSSGRRNDLNMAGGNVKDLPGRVARQGHDVWLIRRAASVLDPSVATSRMHRARASIRKGGTAQDAVAWVDWVHERIDADRTYPEHIKGDAAAEKKWLHTIYDEFNNGFVGAYTELDPLEPARQGFNPAKALQEDRVLHFTPDGAFEYMSTFGHGSLKDTVLQEIDMTGNRLGLMQTLGLNPYNNLQTIVSSLKKTAKGDAIAGLEKYSSGFEKGFTDSAMAKQYLTVSGATNRVVSDVGALIGTSVRTFEYVTKLGFSALSSVADLGSMAADLQIQQRNFAEAMGQALLAPMEGLAPSDKKAFAEAMGIGIDGLLGLSFDRMGALDSPSGRLSKTMGFYFKMNMLGPWTDASRKGLYIANSRFMARMFDNNTLSEKYRGLLAEYHIGSEDIEFLRTNMPMVELDQGRFFDANKIREIPDSKFVLSERELSLIEERVKKMPEVMRAKASEDAMLRKIHHKRRELESKFRSFFIDRNDFGVLTPGADTRALIQRGRGRGDPWREMSEMFWQFKQFPWTMVNTLMKKNVVNRELGVMAFHIGALTGLGAVSMMIKDTFKNREPFIPKTKLEMVKFFTAAMSNGGALGLYADFILGEFEGKGDILRLMGPAANDILDVSVVGKDALLKLFGEDKYDSQLGSSLWKSIRNDIPFTNIFYSKSTMDFLMLYWLAETLSPGFLDKQEAGLKHHRLGRGSIIEPRDVVPYGGLRTVGG